MDFRLGHLHAIMGGYRCKLIFSLALAMCTVTVLPQNPASVFITAGQSNAEGRATVEDLPVYLKDFSYGHLRYAFVRSAQTGKFGDFRFGDTFAFCDVTNYFIDRAMDADFYAIKCTYGGTSIAPGATEPGKPVWYAGREWLRKNKAHSDAHGGMSLALSLTEGFAKCAGTTLSKLPGGYDVKAIMWHQGESDRTKAGDYYRNFKEMITFMRERIYAVTGKEKDKTLPFIFGTVPHASRQYDPLVEAAQLQVARELPNVHAIDLSDAGLQADGLHFDGAWTEYVGKLMFDKLVGLGLVDAPSAGVSRPPVANGVDSLLTWHYPQIPNGKAVVICPGGGYGHHAMGHEGNEVAEWLAGKGYLCVVLKYRLPGGQSNIPLDDAWDAIRLLRGKSDELCISPDRIGIMGFSAGGHLAASVATLGDSLGRPDFQILMNPVISMSPEITHWGTRNHLIGMDAPSLLAERYSLERQVDGKTPPAIIILSADDPAVSPENSLRYFNALRENHVPVSMFIYPNGGHGWGMKDSFAYKGRWMYELENWLEGLDVNK